MAHSILLLGLLASAAVAQKVTFQQGDPKRFTYKYMKTPLSGPCDVSEGPDGLIYVQELLANKIVKYNQHTDQLTEYDIPFTTGLLPNLTLPLPGNAKAAFLTCAIRNGFDGLMYFSNGNRNQLVQHNTSDGSTRVFTPPGLLQPVGNLQPLNDLTTAPDGVYFSMTSANQLAKFDYHTHKFTFFDVPTLAAVPLGMYYARDGGIWFLEFAGEFFMFEPLGMGPDVLIWDVCAPPAQKVGRLDRKTGAIKEFPVGKALGPVVVRAETKDAKSGDWLLWFAAVVGGGVGSINERTGKVKFYAENLGSNAVEVAQDYQNNVWISHITQNTLGVYNPTHDNFTEVIMPGTIAPTPVSVPVYGGSGIYNKPVGNPHTRRTENAIWFTQLTMNRLVKYDLTGLKY